MPPRVSKKSRTSVVDERAVGELVETNTHNGFVNLPLDLHILILRNFPAIPEEEFLVNPLFLEQLENGLHYLDRFRVTRTLSQICHDLRRFYLPLCWERVQACMRTKATHWFRDFSLQIIEQSNGLLRQSAHLLPLVKSITVCLTRADMGKYLPLLAELMENLPNLESIEVPHAHGSMGAVIGQNFKGKSFPSVRSAILPNCAGPILGCCPEIREVTCIEYDGARLITALLDGNCNKVEILRGVTASGTTLKRYARLNPPIRCVRIPALHDTGECIRRFACFPSLRVIEINCSEEKESHLIPELVQAAKETLQSCSTFDLATKSKSTQVKKEAEAARQKLANIYSEPKLVRVRYLPGAKPRKDFDHENPSYYYPSRIEEFTL